MPSKSKKVNRYSPSRVKARSKRPSPSSSATEYRIGSKKRGNDGNMWKIIKSGNSRRWSKVVKSPKKPVKVSSRKRKSKSVKRNIKKRSNKKKSVSRKRKSRYNSRQKKIMESHGIKISASKFDQLYNKYKRYWKNNPGVKMSDKQLRHEVELELRNKRNNSK